MPGHDCYSSGNSRSTSQPHVFPTLKPLLHQVTHSSREYCHFSPLQTRKLGIREGKGLTQSTSPSIHGRA